MLGVTTEAVVHRIRKEYERLDYAFFENGDFDLNLFGIRSADYGDLFNDILGCVCKVNGEWRVWLWPGTTDPGQFYLQNPANSNGTAIVAAGQNRAMWIIDKHGGKYEALCHRGTPIKIYRDVNRDELLDFPQDKIRIATRTLNWHRSGIRDSEEIDKWSAGCQVHQLRLGFEESMTLARLQQVFHPGWTSYTYTLFTLMDEPTAERSPQLECLFNYLPAWQRDKSKTGKLVEGKPT